MFPADKDCFFRTHFSSLHLVNLLKTSPGAQNPQSCSAQRPTLARTQMVSEEGMILRGKEENEKFHFADSGSPFEILRKLDELQDGLFF